ncbi:unnamed protein product [Malus baccata var. baccata]
MNKILVIGIALLVCFMLQCEERVDPNLSHWTDGKKFKTRDLVYKTSIFMKFVTYIYIYDGVTITYGSGNDHVVLTAYTKYFAAADVDYCKIGVKIKVDVE